MQQTSPSPQLTPCQAKALRVLECEGNVFLTGAAGTGKSFLLDRYLEGKASADFPVVASTGAAAVIVGGRTFHSFFGLGILEGGADTAVLRALRNRKVLHRLQRACTVIIDEISMLSGTTILAAETVARRARCSNKPWGGLRIIAVGDFAQLPPVAPGHLEKDWAFLHPVWEESDFEPALLSTVMRTQDVGFLEILNLVREGIVDERVETFFRLHSDEESHYAEGTRLYPHRAQAEAYNLRRLEELPAETHVFQTNYIGAAAYVETAKRNVPIPESLLLKVGALVMMCKNDTAGEMRWVNGSLGTIRRIDDEALQVALLSGDTIDIGKEKFSCLDGDGSEVMAAWNFPVTLAWATTIHKAQGASLDRLIVDLHALWEPGQAYVALSRVRSGEGLRIERWSRGSIRAEPLVTEFYNALADRAKKYVPRPLFVPPPSRMRDAEPATPKKPKAVRQKRAELIARLLTERASLANIAAQCGIKEQRVLVYIEKLLASGTKPDLHYLLADTQDRQKILDAFEEQGTEFLKPVYEKLGGTVSYDTLRLARCVRFAHSVDSV